MDIIDSFMDSIDISFKYILLAMNFMTIIFVYIFKNRNKKPREHHILFVTAHPDDQCMFFRPTISNLKDDYFIHLLCLSGKGSTRQQQLVDACKYIGVDEVRCISDQKLVDGMKEKWCEETILNYLSGYIKQKSIRAIFTFDDQGVSGHLNHRAIFNSIKQLQVAQNTKGSIKVYYLNSVNILRKYSGLSQLPIALIKTYSWISFSPFNAYKAMSFHKSQFVWYRKIWVFLSRYCYINTFQQKIIKIKQQEQQKQQK